MRLTSARWRKEETSVGGAGTCWWTNCRFAGAMCQHARSVGPLGLAFRVNPFRGVGTPLPASRPPKLATGRTHYHYYTHHLSPTDAPRTLSLWQTPPTHTHGMAHLQIIWRAGELRQWNWQWFVFFLSCMTKRRTGHLQPEGASFLSEFELSSYHYFSLSFLTFLIFYLGRFRQDRREGHKYMHTYMCAKLSGEGWTPGFLLLFVFRPVPSKSTGVPCIHT